MGSALDGETTIELAVNPQAHNVVGKTHAARMRPDKRLDAQFSIYWCVAVALAHGAVLPGHLVSEVPASPAVASWMRRIRCAPATGASDRDIGGCTLTATGPFGARSVTVNNAKGHPDDPVSDDELRQKFAHNVGLAGVTRERIAELAERLWSIGDAPDAAGLVQDIVAARDAAA
jgi:2-methylcitrate dehydratase PrpD